MYCKNCGKALNQNEMFCANCGTKVEKEISNSQTQTNIMYDPMKSQKGSKSIWIIIVAIILLLGIGLVAKIVSSVKDSKKFVCTSNEGNITLMHNESGLVGYLASGIDYDFDTQKEYAREMGINSYLNEFNNWFMSNTSGSCTFENKTNDKEENKENDNENTIVGDNKYGYINIPSNWVRFYDVDGTTSLQYSYANLYIVTLNYFEDSTHTAKEYASNYLYNKQNSNDVKGVTGATVKIGKNKQYTAYQVYMYYPLDKVYLITYWFEAEDGKVHYIALEGPSELNGMQITDYLYIAESFSLNK